MDRAVKTWLIQIKLNVDAATLAKKLNKSYTVYGCMLLWPPTAFEGPEWTSFSPSQLDLLYSLIAKELKITHIGVNKPIPLHNDGVSKDENILRSPVNFTPVYGDFGPETASNPPTQSDFDNAFWVTAKQNGIYQTWAPRWTMFSRGNISEKARLLELQSVKSAAEEGSTAVDLYAGIGYFAFSYAKAGMQKVLCWDLNPWSVEGLRRGAKKNKWECRISDEDATGEENFLVFNETNETASERIERMRGSLPPIRHVNCGMLPNSRKGLKIAAKVLDPVKGGWVHWHENFLVEQIEAKAEETRIEMQRIVGEGYEVELDFINRLKNYAPGVMHCVLDLAIIPKT